MRSQSCQLANREAREVRAARIKSGLEGGTVGRGKFWKGYVSMQPIPHQYVSEMKNALNITLPGLPRTIEGGSNERSRGKDDPLPTTMVFDECGAKIQRRQENSIALDKKIATSSQFSRRANGGELEERAARVKGSSDDAGKGYEMIDW